MDELRSGEEAKIDTIMHDISSLSKEGQEVIFDKLKTTALQKHKDEIHETLTSVMETAFKRHKEKLDALPAQPNLLDRTEMIIQTLSFANTILKEKYHDHKDIEIDIFKKNMVELVIYRYLLQAIEYEENPEKIEEIIAGMKRRIQEHNAKHEDAISALPEEDEGNEKLLEFLQKHAEKSFMANKFAENMHQYFTKDFSEMITNARFGREYVNKEDEAKILESALAIAQHACDFVDYFKGKLGVNYYKNLQYLLSDLDLDKITSREFAENNIELSTRASNVLVKILRHIGGTEFDALIDNYYIFPKDIQKEHKE